jgi:hypothetical protein
MAKGGGEESNARITLIHWWRSAGSNRFLLGLAAVSCIPQSAGTGCVRYRLCVVKENATDDSLISLGRFLACARHPSASLPAHPSRSKGGCKGSASGKRPTSSLMMRLSQHNRPPFSAQNDSDLKEAPACHGRTCTVTYHKEDAGNRRQGCAAKTKGVLPGTGSKLPPLDTITLTALETQESVYSTVTLTALET